LVAPSSRDDAPISPRGQAADRDDFFADPSLRVFQIELSEAAMESLRRSSNAYVSGTVREGAQVFTNVGIHLKGIGSFQPLERKPSFVVRFNEFAPGLAYRGLTKLMLNNSVQDQTYLAEWLATGLFRDAGVPAARMTHARVMLNGRALGLYVAAEAMNKRFLQRWFREGTGNLYEGYVRDIDAPLEQDNGRDESQEDVRALLAACRISDPSGRWRRLRDRLDVERFVSFAAMETLIAHWDGYTLHTNIEPRI
jgi:spore coat protein CotH